jgi:hypothetical protein
MNSGDDVLRTVIVPLPAKVERAWVAFDRLTQRLHDLRSHAPGVEPAEQELARDTLRAALSKDEPPNWPSAVDVLAARQDLEAHKASMAATHLAHTTAEMRVGTAIRDCERELCRALDDRLAALQDDELLNRAAHAVPLGVGSDGLLASGSDIAGKAALLGNAAGHFDRIKAARRVIFEQGTHPQTAPWMDFVAEGMEDGLLWKSEHVRGEAEQPPWAGGVGGELHYAIASGIRLRVMTAAQLDAAGYQPPGIHLQPIRMG